MMICFRVTFVTESPDGGESRAHQSIHLLHRSHSGQGRGFCHHDLEVVGASIQAKVDVGVNQAGHEGHAFEVHDLSILELKKSFGFSSTRIGNLRAFDNDHGPINGFLPDPVNQECILENPACLRNAHESPPIEHHFF